MIRHTTESGSSRKRPSGIALPGLIWVVFLVASLLFLGMRPVVWAIGVTASAVVLALALSSNGPRWHPSVDRRDLVGVAVLYAIVVALLVIAFQLITPSSVIGFWLTLGLAVAVGVAGPLLHQVWYRKRGLGSVGIDRHHLLEALTLGLILVVAQFGSALWDYRPQDAVAWVPLVVVALVVGFFDVLFFRGYVQTRLEASFGTGPGLAGAALLYSLHFLAYGISLDELWLLTGLGVLYGIAYRLVESIFVLWPLVASLNMFFILDGSVMGIGWGILPAFALLGLSMAGLTWWARRHRKGRLAKIRAATPGPP
jgi:hypothetical protein